jgi:hypothetical protein
MRGRRPALTAADALGICLHWLLSPVEESLLCVIFCVSPATLNVAKNRALEVLFEVLPGNKWARVKWPNAAEVFPPFFLFVFDVVVFAPAPNRSTRVPPHYQIERYAALIRDKQPRLQRCFAAIDGLHLKIQRSGNRFIQNANYNMYYADHGVCNTLVTAPTGEIIWAAINIPGMCLWV